MQSLGENIHTEWCWTQDFLYILITGCCLQSRQKLNRTSSPCIPLTAAEEVGNPQNTGVKFAKYNFAIKIDLVFLSLFIYIQSS